MPSSKWLTMNYWSGRPMYAHGQEESVKYVRLEEGARGKKSEIEKALERAKRKSSPRLS
ncbi:MAG: hypothetical protein OK439_00070 [Thaumarchaeota archaeon]|nr:hypothetical protein [Nitrososphaerota archaeon]